MAQDPSNAPDVASELEVWADGYGLVEGPRLDPEGNLYFSDVTQGGVYRRASRGGIETLVPRRRGVGGIALHASGGLVLSGRDICHVNAGSTRILFERPEGVGGFNDLFVDARGRVLTGSLRSDPFSLEGDRVAGECYRVDGEGRAVVLYGDVGLSNGIGFSPDGRCLYHSDTVAGHVIAHDVDPEGAVSRRRVFAEVRMPDGLCVDAEGGVWVASFGGGCVLRFDAAGALCGRLAVPALRVASVCLGGPDRRDLVVTTQADARPRGRGGAIFHARSSIPGLPPPLAGI